MKNSNQLQTIVAESGLDSTKAAVMLEKFMGSFELSAEWEVKAKSIVVTDASQTGYMKMAREGRLFLREKRIEIEKTRKAMKEQSLREGKAIDGIANILKALIVPIEEYLAEQENFVELKAQREAEEVARVAQVADEKERLRIEAEEQAERERIAKENEKLRRDAAKKERELAEERRKVEANKEKLQAKAESEKKIAQEKIDSAKREIEVARQEQIRLKKELASQVECPECGHNFSPKQNH